MEELLPILQRIATALERQNELVERSIRRAEQWYREQGKREDEHVRMRQAEAKYARSINRAAAEGMTLQLQHTLDLLYKTHQRAIQEEEGDSCGPTP